MHDGRWSGGQNCNVSAWSSWGRVSTMPVSFTSRQTSLGYDSLPESDVHIFFATNESWRIRNFLRSTDQFQLRHTWLMWMDIFRKSPGVQMTNIQDTWNFACRRTSMISCSVKFRNYENELLCIVNAHLVNANRKTCWIIGSHALCLLWEFAVHFLTAENGSGNSQLLTLKHNCWLLLWILVVWIVYGFSDLTSDRLNITAVWTQTGHIRIQWFYLNY